MLVPLMELPSRFSFVLRLFSFALESMRSESSVFRF